MPPSRNSKYIELTALRNNLISKLRETFEVAESAQDESSLITLFKRRYQHIDEIYSRLEATQESILAIVASNGEPDFEVENNIRKDFDRIYFQICAIYDELVESNLLPSSANPEIVNRKTNVRLPKINLANFDGRLECWSSFIQLFNSVIHNVTSLSNVEKYQYLLSCLCGEPLSLIKALDLSDSNYPIAYKTLVDRYSDKRKLANHYWDTICSLPQLKEASPKGLRDLFDTFRENLSALRALKLGTSLEDFILLNLLIGKLDINTRTQFESQIRNLNQEIPAFETLETFIESECRVLGNLNTKKFQTGGQRSYFKNPKHTFHVTSTQLTTDKCFICNKDHLTYSCSELKQNTPHQRFDLIKSKGLCINCLSGLHTLRNCKSKSSCRKCHKNHHTLLHFERPAQEPQITTIDSPEASGSALSPLQALVSSMPNKIVLLSTVLLDIRDALGQTHTIRAILDGGSEGCFITSSCAQRLGLRIKTLNRIEIQGIGSASAFASSGTVSCVIYPRDEIQPSHMIDAHVIPNISKNIPTAPVDPSSWTHIKDLRLADPQFNIPGKIELLLGADIFAELLRPGVVVGLNQTPSAMNTIFGWVLSGPAHINNTSRLNSFFISCSEEPLDLTLRRFWEIEELTHQIPPSQDDAVCEQLYKSSVSRNSNGRYTVSLPFKIQIPEFPNSRSVALRRLHSLENRFLRDEPLRKAYVEFMTDYLESGHMSHASQRVNPLNAYYIPHHCVFKSHSTTTKLRVVFDASARSPGEQSLNDCLYPGPTLLPSIVDVLLKFRSHSVVFIADIKQMYRQVLIAPSDRNYQRILWRFSPNDPVQEYSLNTVTYGVSAAPYLAIRTLHQLAEDEQHNFPIASAILQRDVYVDDVVSGCSSLSEAQLVQSQLIELLNSGGFLLRKWASNVPELLSNLDSSLCQGGMSFDAESESTIKILGLQWFSSLDTFSFKVDSVKHACTKRQILSEIARIFDPLGFLAPLTFFSKHLIQHLWCLGLDWDVTPPDDVIDRWNRYRNELPLISNIKIERHVLTQNYSVVELHGFCDASEAGYAAVVYFRIIDNVNNVYVKFVTAKTKVAPLKKRSLPQLELCAAHLLSNVISTVLTIYSSKLSQTVAWTDSTIVLAWLRSSPHRWKTFVSNRVSHIQDRISPSSWRHIRSEDNPADCASRGLMPSELVDHSLWWTGPAWLKSPYEFWPSQNINFSNSNNAILKEERNVNVFVAKIDTLTSFDNLLHKYSTLDKILRIVGYCCRFINKLKDPHNVVSGAFTTAELHRTLLFLVKMVQYQVFNEEINNLKTEKSSSKPLRKLNLFLDKESIVRVGGRLHNSQLKFEEKHPALLPQSHRLTSLIIEDTHRKHLHPGFKTLNYLIRQNFWILSPHRAIHRCLSDCYICFRAKPKSLQPPMGDLPAVRVTQIKAFDSVGVDFGGPFTITMGKVRGAKTYKAYICLFVCLATKALHLELVSELSTNAFLAALRRFISRRGRCRLIMSDCGTNFVGAARTLTTYFQGAVDQEGIQWKFNPPSAPHFGGIWEAGIKSVKTHINRVIGAQILTFEEFATVLAQIEAVLNSRPLCPLSSDPNDLEVLTPGHYLTLAPLTCVPDPDYTNVNLNRLNRWQLLQNMHQHFWKRWHHEYLHTLQQRSKWTSNAPNLTLGTMVLLKDDLSPPLRWRPGRVVELHPDSKGTTRVVTIKTAQGTLKRPVVKLCPLPNQ